MATFFPSLEPSSRHPGDEKLDPPSENCISQGLGLVKEELKSPYQLGETITAVRRSPFVVDLQHKVEKWKLFFES